MTEPHFLEATPKSLIDRRYVVRREIARGGMGIVFEAEHELTRSHVAIKALTTEALGWPNLHARLFREARALAVARHAGVVEVLDAGQCEHHGPYVVLEMIDGRSLESFLLARQTLDVESTIAVADQLGSALAHAHSKGVVHRDVKPGNVLVTRVPGRDGDVLKLVDFGIARVEGADDVVDRKLTQDSDVVGTIEFMAPEQILDGRPPTPLSDVYALGVTLYELLVGDVPFPGAMSEVMKALLAGRPIPTLRRKRTDVPAALEAVIFRAMSRAPSDRFSSPRELADACVAILGRAPRLALLEPPRAAPEGASRRQHVRAPYVTPTRIVAASGPCDGRTEDVSEGGLLVVTHGTCAEGERVSVRLPLPSSGRVVTLSAIARWAKTQRGQRAIGVEFDALPDEVRDDIRRYVSVMGVSATSTRTVPRASSVRTSNGAQAAT